jgi:hypothetical protein
MCVWQVNLLKCFPTNTPNVRVLHNPLEVIYNPSIRICPFLIYFQPSRTVLQLCF